VYTRTGDKGTSSLYTGERRPKEDAIFEAVGTTDEVSSAIGLAREYSELQGMNDTFLRQLERIQCMLQDVNSNIATPRNSTSQMRLKRTEFDVDGKATEELEKWIDAMDNTLPPLTKFILPVSC
jgi:cob(I)alamin adenosyltransferase